MKVSNKRIQGADSTVSAGRSYQDEEEVATTKGKGRLVAILLVFVVVLSLVVGGGIYGWMQKRQRDYDTVAKQVSQSNTAKKESESVPKKKEEDKGSLKAQNGLPSISSSEIDTTSASADDVKKALVGLPQGINGKSQGALEDTVDYKINQMFDLYGLGLAGTGGILYQSGDYALVCYKGGYTVAVKKTEGIPVALRSADNGFSADTKSKIGNVYVDGAKYDTLLGKESLVLNDSLYAQAKEALEK